MSVGRMLAREEARRILQMVATTFSRVELVSDNVEEGQSFTMFPKNLYIKLHK